MYSTTLKNSKGQKNGLMCYIFTELIPELQRKGERYSNGIQDLVPIALPRYQKLSREEKARFEDMAKENKAKQRENLTSSTKLRDNLGNFVDERVDLKERIKTKRLQDRKQLQSMINNLTDSELLVEKFYLIGFQYMICMEDRTYYPLEYGVVEWCMTMGITNTMHGFINPGDIPLGYRFAAQAHSKDSHRIPLEEFSNGESDYRGIWIQLERFMKSDNSYSNSLPVYCTETDYLTVSGCLSWLCHHSRMTNHFQVNILEELASVLFMKKNFNISETSLFDLLTTSAYDFESNTKCPRHEDVEAKHCAIGLPKKYMYALSDALSDHYGFSLTPSHLPTVSSEQNSRVLTAENSRLIPRQPVGRGSAKTMVEPVTYASRDIRCLSGQGETSRDVGSVCRRYNDDDDHHHHHHHHQHDNYDDNFPALQDYPSVVSVGSNNSNLQPRFATSAFKAPGATSLPCPSPALLQQNLRTKHSQDRPKGEDFNERFQKSDIQSTGDCARKLQTADRIPPSKLTLAGIAESFRSQCQMQSEENQLICGSSEEYSGDVSAGIGSMMIPGRNQLDLSARKIPSIIQDTSGRGQGLVDLAQTPSRVGTMASSGSRTSSVPFSPVGRGHAFMASTNSPGHRPSNGFGSNY